MRMTILFLYYLEREGSFYAVIVSCYVFLLEEKHISNSRTHRRHSQLLAVHLAIINILYFDQIE